MESEKTKEFWKTEPWLGGLALLLLLLGCFFVLRPFITALMWAMILAYSLYPMQRMFTRWFRGSRTLAACLVSLTVTVVLVGPVVMIGVSIAQDGKDLAVATRNWFMAVPDQPPAWVGQMPVLGNELGVYWTSFAEDRNRWMEQLDKEVKTPPPRPKIVVETGEGLVVQEPSPALKEAVDEEVAAQERKADSSHVVFLLGRLLGWARSWLISAGKAVGQGVTQVLISAFLAFFLLRDAPELSERLVVAVERLAGPRGRHLIKVAGDTVRGVIFRDSGHGHCASLGGGVGVLDCGGAGGGVIGGADVLFCGDSVWSAADLVAGDACGCLPRTNRAWGFSCCYMVFWGSAAWIISCGLTSSARATKCPLH